VAKSRGGIEFELYYTHTIILQELTDILFTSRLHETYYPAQLTANVEKTRQNKHDNEECLICI